MYFGLISSEVMKVLFAKNIFPLNLCINWTCFSQAILKSCRDNINEISPCGEKALLILCILLPLGFCLFVCLFQHIPGGLNMNIMWLAGKFMMRFRNRGGPIWFLGFGFQQVWKTCWLLWALAGSSTDVLGRHYCSLIHGCKIIKNIYPFCAVKYGYWAAFHATCKLECGKFNGTFFLKPM